MRLILLPIALLTSAPACAQDKSDLPSDKVAQLAGALDSPAMQSKVTDLVSAFANALLDTHVGPLAHYTNPRDGIRPDDTLGDIVRRDDPNFDQRLRQRTRGAVAATGQLAHDGAAMSAELGKTVSRLRNLLDAAKGAAGGSADDR